MQDEQAEYWYCVAGPAYRSELPWGASFPMGEAVKNQFAKLTGELPDVCGGGWGVTYSQSKAISFATYGDDLKREVIASYHQEGKAVPRHMHAWELLFKEEDDN